MYALAQDRLSGIFANGTYSSRVNIRIFKYNVVITMVKSLKHDGFILLLDSESQFLVNNTKNNSAYFRTFRAEKRK